MDKTQILKQFDEYLDSWQKTRAATTWRTMFVKKNKATIRQILIDKFEGQPNKGFKDFVRAIVNEVDKVIRHSSTFHEMRFRASGNIYKYKNSK